jgi:dihydrofolate reductase
VAESVARLRAEPGKDLVIPGSGNLIRSLMPHNLIDRYILQIAPLVLGSGQRLFADDGIQARPRLVDVRHTRAGVVIAAYEPAWAPVRRGRYAIPAAGESRSPLA